MRTELLRSILAAWLLLVGGAAFARPPEVVRWSHYEDPVFPTQLLSTTVRQGFATVVFTFDGEGKVTDRVALSASHPEFAGAVNEAIREWKVDIGQLPQFVRREIVRFDFERHGSIVALSQRDATKAAFNAYGDEAATAVRTCREDQLSSPLETLATALPQYPSQLRSKHVRGIVTLSFIVDAEGQVRVPAVIDATDAEFGEAGLVAIRQWRFQPPQQNGVPVQVMVERTFRFGAAGK